jgi:hypothetical protein
MHWVDLTIQLLSMTTYIQLLLLYRTSFIG